MNGYDVERIVWARRLGPERLELRVYGEAIPLEDFEFVAVAALHDEYDPASGHIGPLRGYVLFYDSTGMEICGIQNDTVEQALGFAEGLGVPAAEWTAAREELGSDRVLPETLRQQL